MTYYLLDSRKTYWAVIAEVRRLLLLGGADPGYVRRFSADRLRYCEDLFEAGLPLNQTAGSGDLQALVAFFNAAGCRAPRLLYFSWATEAEMVQGIAPEVASYVSQLVESVTTEEA